MIRRALVLLSIIAAVCGGVLIDKSSAIGWPLSAIGVIGAVYMYWSSEKSKEASDDLFDATSQLLINSGAGNPYTQLVMNKLSKPGGYVEAIYDLEKALQADPNDSDALALYAQIGAIQYSLRVSVAAAIKPGKFPDPTKIEQAIERGLKTGSRLAEFYCARGVMLDMAGRGVEARHYFYKGEQLQPGWRWRAYTCTSFGIEGDFASALAEIEYARRHGGSGYLVDFYHGRCLAALGEFQEALKMFGRVMRHRGLFYQLAVAMQEAHYFEWQPFRSAYYEFRAAFFAVYYSRRKALDHAATAAVHCVTPALLLVGQKTTSLATQTQILRGTKLSKLYALDEPFASLGVALIKNRKILASKRLLLKAVERPARISTWQNLCCAALLTQDWAVAERACAKLLESSPDSTEFRAYEKAIQDKRTGVGYTIEKR